jgi:glycerate 2-kinase
VNKGNRKLGEDARAVFEAGLAAADARKAVERVVSITERGELVVGPLSRRLEDIENIYVVGAGKAAWPMASALEDIIGPRISGGDVTTKCSHGGPLRFVSISEAGHPVPDEAGVSGAKTILGTAEAAGPDDLVVCLVSGGGSSLMPLPVANVTLEDKQLLTKKLLECGATIHEINALRKHLSAVKGGRLAAAAAPATVVSLILSDVTGDDLDVIASGPTVPDRSTFEDCLAVLDAYGIRNEIPPSVLAYLERGSRGEEEETPKPGNPAFSNTHTLIIGSASLSVEAARREAVARGYNTVVLSSSMEGEAREAAKIYAAVAREILHSGNPAAPPACVISGGETTVTIRGKGRGGRNQEFALAAALAIEGMDGIVVLSGGTDGTDGPTNAAGAVVDGGTVERGRRRGRKAFDYLKRNDSYRFFEGTGEHLITGPTLTNVMDLYIMTVCANKQAGDR